MKRLVALALSLSIVGGAVPVNAAPGVIAAAEQFAEADWLVVTGRETAEWYFAVGLRSVSEGGVATIGFVGKGNCDVDRGKHMMSISCSAQARGHELGPDAFEFDPMLASARMELEHGGFKHEVGWTGRSRLPAAGGDFGVAEEGAAAGAGMARWAVASGKLFGRKLPEASRGRFGRAGSIEAFAFLSQGAYAVVYTDFGRSLRIDDGVARVRATFEIPLSR